MRYRIFPAIGIARLGEDDNFFLGPERPGAGPGELQPDGSVAPVVKYKDATRTKIRKQGARFHLFESGDGQPALDGDRHLDGDLGEQEVCRHPTRRPTHLP
jgi:L-Lysine epsilon oxidase N-terminal